MDTPGLHSGYTVWWAAWFGVFAIVEGAALISGEPGRTLTAHVRWLMRDHAIWAAGVTLLLLWLIVHFLIETWQ